MATFTAAQAGNWNDFNTWGNPGGGGGSVEGTDYPGNGDAVDLAGFVVALNIARVPATGTLGAISASAGAAAGRLTVALQTAGTAREMCCTTMTCGTAGADGLLQLSGTTNNSFTLTCTDIIGGATTNNIVVFRNTTGSGTLTINCSSITGGSGNTARGIRNYDTGPLVINISGNISGGSNTNSHGIHHNINSGSLTINGTGSNIIQGGSTAVNYGLLLQSTGITINDMIIKGGTFLGCAGISAGAGTAYTLHGCSIDHGSTTVALIGAPPTMTPDANDYILFGTQYYAAQKLATELKKSVVNGTITGTYDGGRFGVTP